MRVAICYNDSIFRSELHGLIVEYKRKRRIHVDTTEFDSGEALLSHKGCFDIIFLGYLLPNANGMQVARELRSRNITSSIVFVTDYPHFVYDAFEVGAYRFFIKPIDKEKFRLMMDSFILDKKESAPITVVENGMIKNIRANEIVYLEGDGKYCVIRTVSDTLHSSKTLSEVLESIHENCFFRIHKSYAVNMNYISKADNRYITFLNGEKAIISRACLADFKEAYKNFTEKIPANI